MIDTTHSRPCVTFEYHATISLSMLKWARQNGHHTDFGITRRGCRWNATKCADIARRGDLEALQWAREHECEWDITTAENAARHGHLCVVKWVLLVASFAERSKHRTYKLVTRRAIEGGHLPIIEWVESKSNQILTPIEYCHMAIEYNQPHVLEWALPLPRVMAYDAAYDADLCRTAAKYNRLEILQWLRSKFYLWNETTCEAAIEHKDLRLLQWARDQGCPWNARTCTRAAESQNFQGLKWARAHGCPWNQNTCFGACENDDYEMFCWARDNGCEVTDWSCDKCLAHEHRRLVAQDQYQL